MYPELSSARRLHKKQPPVQHLRDHATNVCCSPKVECQEDKHPASWKNWEIELIKPKMSAMEEIQPKQLPLQQWLWSQEHLRPSSQGLNLAKEGFHTVGVEGRVCGRVEKVKAMPEQMPDLLNTNYEEGIQTGCWSKHGILLEEPVWRLWLRPMGTGA